MAGRVLEEGERWMREIEKEREREEGREMMKEEEEEVGRGE